MATPIPENRAPFTSKELASLFGAAPGVDVVGVSTDTRTLTKGNLFVALTGQRFDGHRHLSQAKERGAAAALVESAGHTELPTLVVPSALDALGALGAHHLERWRSPDRKVIALTGSAGKTTTKEAIGALAGAVTDNPLVTVGNLNNRVGVPMTVLGLAQTHDVAVLELGTNAPGEIDTLARIAQPDIAVITLVAAAHTEGLGGIEGVAKEKGALFSHLREGGIAIGNMDDSRVAALLVSMPRFVGYGMNSEADYRIARREVLTPFTQRMTLVTTAGSRDITTPFIGNAGALATAAAVCAVETWRGKVLEPQAIDAALATVDPRGRLAPQHLASGLWIIDDSYNANPASCRSSIATACEIADALGRRVVLVLGEMLELGALSEEEHRAIGELAAERASGPVICVAGDAEHAHRAAAKAGAESVFAADADEAAAIATDTVTERDLVLVKGSRGTRTERVVAALVKRHGGAA